MTRLRMQRGLLALLAGVPGMALMGACAAQPVGFRVSLSMNEEQRAPLSVSFTAQAPAEYRVEWDFGDGGTGQGRRVTHTYYRPGTYTLRASLLDSRGRVRSTATSQVEVASSGPERAGLVLLLGDGEVRLSAAGSVVYRPATPSFTLDGRAVGAGPVPVAAGPHRASVRMTGTGGALEQSLTFRMAPLTLSVPFETEVLRLTNQARARGWNCATLKEGGPALPPLTRDPKLEGAALAQSAGMALHGYFDHESPVDGSSPWLRVQATGFEAQTTAENIAAGQTTPQEVVDGWLRSPGHCRNIMGDFTRLGVAYVNRPDSEYGRYWTQVFATPAQGQ
ncbi:CAP domain-containing protein [Deinococcus planocerae]|uniref:CAP domain-containing protein n=1 Tax=Deinococcus planocerae TaxID=1737569 RepID=UPI001FE2B533|nr:CAP domain-containing protein [Deinococcus planocerae]